MANGQLKTSVLRQARQSQVERVEVFHEIYSLSILLSTTIPEHRKFKSEVSQSEVSPRTWFA